MCFYFFHFDFSCIVNAKLVSVNKQNKECPAILKQKFLHIINKWLYLH